MQRSKNVLVVGSGGREHALVWKLARDGANVFAAPGNAGTASEAKNLPIEATDSAALLDAVKQHEIDLVVVGPEAPLVDGLVDKLTEAGVRAFGPSALAAQLEGSKIFCKELLHTNDIPTATYRQFDSLDKARGFLESREDEPVVVKADGLAAGKGVFVCSNREEALDAINQLQRDPQFRGACAGKVRRQRPPFFARPVRRVLAADR